MLICLMSMSLSMSTA